MINEWEEKQKNKKVKAKFVWNRTDFDKLQPNQYDHVFGLFNWDHLNFDIDRIENKIDEPSNFENFNFV